MDLGIIMAFTQQRFLNSSIRGFNCSVGWNNQESRLTVNLVDDPVNDDYFSPPDVGSPVYFDYQGWQFNGLLEKHTTNGSDGGSPLYEVTVVDPRVLLDGVQLILSEYSGSVGGVPNIINVYGYLESFGFGNSGANESGITWDRVVTVVQQLTGVTGAGGFNAYGGPIRYKGFSYAIDLSNLQMLPAVYRIQGSPSISLMEALSEICSASGSEFFVRLEAGNIIKIYTISRFNVPNKNVINQFVSQTAGACSKNVGLEMVNDTCAKMLIGGKKTNLSVRSKSTETNYTNPIWQYWGYDLDGRVILSSDNENNETFTLDLRGLNFVYAERYPTNVGEVRAALKNLESWQSYVSMYSHVEYIPVADGEFQARYYVTKNGNFVQSENTYRHNKVINPHFRKAQIMGLPSTFTQNTDKLILRDQNPANYMNMYNPVLEKKIEEFYNLFRAYVEQYYGRQFMVELPDLYVKTDSETGMNLFSQIPTSGGYLTDEQINDSINNNLLPANYDRLSLDDGRIECYARFNDYRNLDLSYFRNNALSTISNQDILIGANGFSVFVKCTVDPTIVFIGNNYTIPRAIVSLPGIFSTRTNGAEADSILLDFSTNMGNSELADRLANSPFADALNDTMIPRAVHPDLIAVPMESQTDTYGPWYVAGAAGKTEIEHSSDLVPWNYGGYELMNLTGESRVMDAAANLQWLETGSVEYPDIPVLQLGDQLLQSGPYVTDVQVDISENGAKTVYRMSSWTPRFGRLAKYNADRMQKTAKILQETRKNIRQMIITRTKR